MNRSLFPITCLIVLVLLASCVLPGSQPPSVPPTITSVSLPPAGEQPPTGTPTTGAEQPITQTPETAPEDTRAPEVVRLQLTAPPTTSGQPFTVTLLVNNRTRSPLTGARVVMTIPSELVLVEVQDGGEQEGNELIWTLPNLPANNGRAEVHAVLEVVRARPHALLDTFRVEAPGLDSSLVEIPAPRYVFAGDIVPVEAVQGSDDISPYVGEIIGVEGFVTALFPGLEGFFIFQRGGSIDGGSQGLFVRTTQIPEAAQPGIVLRVRGEVSEDDGQTTLVVADPEDIELTTKVEPLPGPIVLNPPQDTEEALHYFEALEGMLVSTGGIAVAPINQYGEFVIVRSDTGVTRLFQGEENGYAIMVDDGSSMVHDDATTLPAQVRTGDLVGTVSGTLAYSFGRFKVEPTIPYQVKTKPVTLPQIAPAADGEISVMTWNVENLFDTLPPSPPDPPMPSSEAYERDLRKVAGTIAAAGAPDVVALQEVENIEVLQAIAEQEGLSSYAYQAGLEEGTDQRGIDVGYLVRSDRMEVVEVRQFAENQGVYTRPPLLLIARSKTTGSEINLINNHFTSMASGVEESEPRRVLQAQGNMSIVGELRESDPNAAIVVLGDLNAFYQSAPIDVLRNGGLQHVLEKLPPEQRYTYIYEGESQVLDHVLVTEPLWQRISRVEILHVNSDFPPPLPEDVSPVGKSDHDPVIVVFSS